MVLKNVLFEFPYIFPDHFIMCLKRSGFPDYWKIFCVVSVFENVREKSVETTNHHVFFPLLIKSLRTLDRLGSVDLHEKYFVFLEFQYGNMSGAS